MLHVIQHVSSDLISTGETLEKGVEYTSTRVVFELTTLVNYCNYYMYTIAVTIILTRTVEGNVDNMFNSYLVCNIYTTVF
jgi:hypothetical protein